MFFTAITALAVSFLVTLILVPVFCKLARRLKFVDEPDGKVKLHTQATPYLGGVAIYAGFVSALLCVFPLENYTFLSLLFGTTLLLVVGLIDDLVRLKAYQKFIGQFVAALCFLRAGIYLREQFFSNYWNIPISLLWILTIVNAFNLVDVMDGLATTIAIGATTTFFFLAVYMQLMNVGVICAAFLGALLAFLWYNKPPACIYMGDAGALFIGGFLAAIPFLFNWGTYHEYGYLVPTIVLALPLLEVCALIIIRSYKGIPFYAASPDHFSLYLLRKGWGKDQILYYIVVLSLVLGCGSYLFISHTLTLSMMVLAGVLFLAQWVFFVFLPL